MSRDGVNRLFGFYTIPLARYEFGNIVWKHHVVRKNINQETAHELLDIGYSLIDRLRMLELTGRETEIYQLAATTRLSFYDASYLYAAEVNSLKLITEDGKLYSAAGKRSVIAVSLSESLAPGKGFEPLRP